MGLRSLDKEVKTQVFLGSLDDEWTAIAECDRLNSVG